MSSDVRPVSKHCKKREITHVDPPSEWSDSGADNGILVDSDNLRVLEDLEGLASDSRELKSYNSLLFDFRGGREGLTSVD
jgi:hypothetical protein